MKSLLHVQVSAEVTNNFLLTPHRVLFQRSKPLLDLSYGTILAYACID